MRMILMIGRLIIPLLGLYRGASSERGGIDPSVAPCPGRIKGLVLKKHRAHKHFRIKNNTITTTTTRARSCTKHNCEEKLQPRGCRFTQNQRPRLDLVCRTICSTHRSNTHTLEASFYPPELTVILQFALFCLAEPERRQSIR